MARYLTLDVRMENAAMQTPAELAVAFTESLNRHGVRGRGTTSPFEAEDSGTVYDSNGNVVGTWRVRELEA